MMKPVDVLGGGARIVCATATLAVHLAIFGSVALLSHANTLPPTEDTVQLALVAEQESEQADVVEPSVAEDQNADKADSVEQRTSETQPVEETAKPDDVPAEVATTTEPTPEQQADAAPEETPVTEAPPTPEPEALPVAKTPAPRAVAVVAAPKKPVVAKKPPPEPKVSRAAIAGKSQQGNKSAGGAANAARYRSMVQAGLAGRKSALGGRGFNGTVAIRFTIGASGGVVSASVARSSGDSSLDSAARQLVANASFPPPPDGHFSAVVPFQVN